MPTSLARILTIAIGEWPAGRAATVAAMPPSTLRAAPLRVRRSAWPPAARGRRYLSPDQLLHTLCTLSKTHSDFLTAGPLCWCLQ